MSARSGRTVLAFLTIRIALVLAPSHAFGQDTRTIATQHFLRGRALYDSLDSRAALSEFREAAALVPSPNARLYVARCLRDLGRLDEAVVEYEQTIVDASEQARVFEGYDETRAAAQQEVRALEPRVGRLTVRVGPVRPSALRIGARVLPGAAAGISLPVLPGDVRVGVDAPAYRSASRYAHVAAGQVVTLDVALMPETNATRELRGDQGSVRQRASSPLAGLAFASFAAAGLSAVAAGGFFAGAEYEYGVARTCNGGCIDARVNDVNRGEAFDYATVISLTAFGVFAVTGLALYLVSRSHGLAPHSRRATIALSRPVP